MGQLVVLLVEKVVVVVEVVLELLLLLVLLVLLVMEMRMSVGVRVMMADRKGCRRGEHYGGLVMVSGAALGWPGRRDHRQEGRASFATHRTGCEEYDLS